MLAFLADLRVGNDDERAFATAWRSGNLPAFDSVSIGICSTQLLLAGTLSSLVAMRFGAPLLLIFPTFGHAGRRWAANSMTCPSGRLDCACTHSAR
jgi:hypothetical protein